jgi:hypothetical protein
MIQDSFLKFLFIYEKKLIIFFKVVLFFYSLYIICSFIYNPNLVLQVINILGLLILRFLTEIIIEAIKFNSYNCIYKAQLDLIIQSRSK